VTVAPTAPPTAPVAPRVPSSEGAAPARSQLRRPRRRTSRSVLVALVLLVVAVNLAPFLWMIGDSFKTYIQTQVPGDIIPHPFIFANYAGLFSGSSSVTRFFDNSLVVSVSVTVLTLVLSVPAAYALARLTTRRTRDLQFTIISLKMMPAVAVLVPFSIVLSELGLTTSLLGLIIVEVMINSAFAVWLLSIFFSYLPTEVEEAGMLDGMGRFGVMWRIALPLARTGVLVVAVFVFIFSWNELPFALVLTGPTTQTLPVYLSGFASDVAVSYQTMSAVGVLQIAPVVILTLLIQKRLVTGLSLGALR